MNERKTSTGDGISGNCFDSLGFLAIMIEIKAGNV